MPTEALTAPLRGIIQVVSRPWPGQRLASLSLFSLVLALLSGCVVTQDYQRPEVTLPATWKSDLQTAGATANLAWWQQFQDPVLDELIVIALEENKDLRIAAARIAEYAGRLQSTTAAELPTIGYTGSTYREQRSLERATPVYRGENRINDNYEASVSVSWELDLWGRIQRSTEAARADLLATEEERAALILSLVSSVAASYLDLLNLDQQLVLTRKVVVDRLEWLNTFEKKLEGGQISAMELAQARSAYQQAAANVPRIELQIALLENSLALLLGHNPEAILRGRPLDAIVEPAVPAGIPADILERRPDIRQKEQNLIAANARIGVARTQYYPNISLTGLVGFASTDISTWLQGSANLYRFGADAVGPIFTGGRIEGEVAQAEARQQQLLHDYLKTIQTALMEVEDALVSIRKLRELLEIQAKHVATLENYVTYSHDRYDAGLSGYLEIFDAEQNLYNIQMQHTQTHKDLLVALVNSYKAMGGGWITEQAAAGL